MAIDKSTKQHYEMQGKVKNYLGKQKMVKAPKKWLSSPDHVAAELAYITPEERDILIKLNLYGSLNGKANKGPSGIMSLQGGGGGSEDKGTGGGRGGGGRDRWDWSPAPAPPPAPRPHQDPTPTRAPEFVTGPKTPKTPKSDRGVTSFKGPVIDTTLDPDWDFQDKKAIAIQKAINPDVYAGVKTGDVRVATDLAKKDQKISKREEERGYTDDGEKIEYIGDKPVTKQTAFNVGLLEKNIKTGEIQRGRNIVNPYTKQIQSKFAPIDTPKKGLWGTIGNIALGILAPQLLPAKLAKAYATYNQFKNISKLASTFTGKDIVGDLTTGLKSNISTRNIGDVFSGKTTATDTRDDRVGQRGDGRSQALQKIAAPKADVVTESVQKFTQPQFTQLQLTELQKRQATLQRYANKGALNKRGQSTLMQLNQMLEQATASMAHGGFIDRPLTGRNRYL